MGASILLEVFDFPDLRRLFASAIAAALSAVLPEDAVAAAAAGAAAGADGAGGDGGEEGLLGAVFALLGPWLVSWGGRYSFVYMSMRVRISQRWPREQNRTEDVGRADKEWSRAIGLTPLPSSVFSSVLLGSYV
jgi:hypothetical protein